MYGTRFKMTQIRHRRININESRASREAAISIFIIVANMFYTVYTENIGSLFFLLRRKREWKRQWKGKKIAIRRQEMKEGGSRMSMRNQWCESCGWLSVGTIKNRKKKVQTVRNLSCHDANVIEEEKENLANSLSSRLFSLLSLLLNNIVTFVFLCNLTATFS